MSLNLEFIIHVFTTGMPSSFTNSSIFLSTRQEIGWEEQLQNDLFSVTLWDVKPYRNQSVNRATIAGIYCLKSIPLVRFVAQLVQ